MACSHCPGPGTGPGPGLGTMDFYIMLCTVHTTPRPGTGWVPYPFLGGLSLHLNHLIESRRRNYDWPFWTLPFRLFGSNLDTRDLETYPRTYSGHFEICQFLTIPEPFEYFSENGWSQKIKVFSMKE